MLFPSPTASGMVMAPTACFVIHANSDAAYDYARRMASTAFVDERKARCQRVPAYRNLLVRRRGNKDKFA